jgi:hypothetical protein
MALVTPNLLDANRKAQQLDLGSGFHLSKPPVPEAPSLSIPIPSAEPSATELNLLVTGDW